ncbi:hypothetical protein PRUPE_5G026800 [Prunus persica]|uniref:Uncharacterized protein n=1 Tax=Prunus persica TaxID=3760 RepID=A0A251P657_PRUPE|nr:hypothetical protein PRUPE_5G026800 [Prunus persica]
MFIYGVGFKRHLPKRLLPTRTPAPHPLMNLMTIMLMFAPHIPTSNNSNTTYFFSELDTLRLIATSTV